MTRVLCRPLEMHTASVCWRGENRGIAQSGSALALGARCREFKSLYPDQFHFPLLLKAGWFMVTVAQLVEPWTVTPVVAGSNPVSHPIISLSKYRERSKNKLEKSISLSNSTMLIDFHYV